MKSNLLVDDAISRTKGHATLDPGCVIISSKDHSAESFKSCETHVNYADQTLTVLPLSTPRSKMNQLKTIHFVLEFPELLEDLGTRCQKLVVPGAINLYFD